MDSLLAKVRCREAQITLLGQLFGKKSLVPCPSIFIYGHSSTGKTFTLSSILKILKLPHAMINCVECYTPKLLFELILRRTLMCDDGESDASFQNCDNTNDFVRNFGHALKSRKSANTFYIVLDNADQLRGLNGNVLSVFLRLQELLRTNVCVVLISMIVWEKFQFGIGLCEPFKIHFPQYTKDEMCEIMSLDRPQQYSKEFYENYLKIVLSVFYIVCCDLTELSYLAKQNFSKYVEPIVNGNTLESNTQKLWRNIEPRLKQALHGVYLRHSVANYGESGAVGVGSAQTRVELPFHSKLLLIAAYMASYNPSRTDRRFFLKRHEKVGKRAKMNKMKRNEKVTCHMLGPKPFLLDRLLAIFYTIVDDKVAPSTHVFSQISSLVTLNLLSSVGKDVVDSPKYKCNVSLDFIRCIAKTVDFDVVRYLYDFV